MACSGCVKLVRAAAAIAHGMAGVAKALLGVDPAPKEVVEERKKICRKCEYAVPCLSNKEEKCWCGKLWRGIWGDNPGCGCALKLKVLVASEFCPVGKWVEISVGGKEVKPPHPDSSS